MFEKFNVNTGRRCEMVDITGQVRDKLRSMGAGDGIAVVYVSHTTAGVTINENADPDVRRDLLKGLEKLAPDRGDYRHSEGNSDAHIKATLTGSSVTVILENGKPALGTWQSIFFCEYDGPRNRTVFVKYIRG